MRTSILESGEVVTFEDPNEGRQIRVESHDEGQVTHAEPGEIAAPATLHLHQQTPLFNYQELFQNNLSHWSEILNGFVVVTENTKTGPYGYIDLLELRSVCGRIERMSKFHIVGSLVPDKGWTYSFQPIGTKLFVLFSCQDAVSWPGIMACIDLETFTIEWQHAQQKVGGGGEGIYSMPGIIQATQYVYGIAIIYSGSRYMVMKYTQAGTMLWQKQFTHTSAWERVLVVENADGSLFVASGQFLEKWDADGNRLWGKKIVVPGGGAYVFFTLQEHDGALYAAIYNWGGGDGFLCRLDLSGDVVWYRTSAGYAIQYSHVSHHGVFCAFFDADSPYDSYVMLISHDNDVRWTRRLHTMGVPVTGQWSRVDPGEAYMWVNTTNGTIQENLILPTNGSGQGIYGDDVTDRIGVWEYENADEPTAGMLTISLVDDAGFTLPSPYALEPAAQTLELIPVIQHFGASS